MGRQAVSQMPETSGYSVADGLATLGPDATRILDALDLCFQGLAARLHAEPMSFPALMRVADLDRIDYFRNFPHLGVVATTLKVDGTTVPAARAGGIEAIDPADTNLGRYVLPSAACYNVYFHLRGRVLDQPRYFTTVARCFRNEAEFEGLARLLSFSMREIVCVGPAEVVRGFLLEASELVTGFATSIGLHLSSRPATDPFFESQGPRAVMQQLSAVKEEFFAADGVALASTNFHRNFFGERCAIALPDGSHAFSGCIGMGLERWLNCLIPAAGASPEKILQRLAEASAQGQGT